MKHEPMDVAAATAGGDEAGGSAAPVDVSLAALQAALSTVASGIDSRFLAAGETLALAYAIVERLIASLEEVSHALDGEAVTTAVEDMHAIADRLTRLPATQETRQTALVTIGDAGKALENPLVQFDRTLRFLRICGLNIKVSAAGAEGFSGFADTMIGRLDVAEEEMRGFVVQIDTLSRSVVMALEAEQQLRQESASVIPEVPLRLLRDALLLQEEQGRSSALASQIASAALDIRNKIGNAIGALQIGDITRQRLEHIVSALGELSMADMRERGDPVVMHVLALLAAQAADTTDEFRQQAGLLAQTLRDVGPNASALIALTGDRTPTGDEGTRAGPLEMLEKSIDEVRTLAERLHDADTISDRIGGATLTTAKALATRLTIIQRVTLDVQQMAWNTDLRSRRLGDAGRGLGAVATEIRNFSRELESFSDDIAAVAKAISISAAAMQGAESGAEQSNVSDVLDVSLLCVREGAQAVREGLSGLDRDAAELSDFLRKTMDDVDCEAEFGAALLIASAELSSLATIIETLSEAPSELAERLARIAATYTMAREREVHRLFAPDLGATESGSGPVADESDDEDDGLF